METQTVNKRSGATSMEVSKLVSKVAELESTVQFILSWLNIDKSELSKVRREAKWMSSACIIITPATTTTTGNKWSTQPRDCEPSSPSRGRPAPKSVKLKRKMILLDQNSVDEDIPIPDTDPLGDLDNHDDDGDILNSYTDNYDDGHAEEDFDMKVDTPGKDWSDEQIICDNDPKACSSKNQKLNPYVLLTKLDSTPSTPTQLGPSDIPLNVNSNKTENFTRRQPRRKIILLRKKKIIVTAAEDPDNKNATEGKKTILVRNERTGGYKIEIPEDRNKTLGDFACQDCDATFPTKTLIECHKIQTGHKIKIYRERKTCEYCGIKSYGGIRFLVHLRKHKREQEDAKGNYICQVCNTRFATYARMKCHGIRMGHKGDKRKRVYEKKTCEYCGIKLYGGAQFLNHMRKHAIMAKKEQENAEGNHICRVCDAKFLTYWRLETHKIKTGHKINKIITKIPDLETQTCEHCGIKLRGGLWFYNHMRKHAVEQENATGDLACHVCDAKFATKNRLQKHKHAMGHTRKRNNEGSAKTSPKGNLETRAKVKRNPEAPKRKNNKGKVSCEYCGYKTYGGVRLQQHLRKHTKEKPFLCNICGGVFSSSHYLATHIKYIHETVGKEYQCKYCDSKFKSLNLLNTHEDIHEGKNDSICPHCGKCVMNLDRHIKEVHDKSRPHECHLCEHKFKKKSHLQRHVASHSNPNRRVKSYHVERPHLNAARVHVRRVPRVKVTESESEGGVDTTKIEADSNKKEKVASSLKTEDAAGEKCVPSSSENVETEDPAVNQVENDETKTNKKSN